MKKESNIHLDPIFKLDFFKWTILANQLIIFVFLVLLRFLSFSVNLCLLIDRYKSEKKIAENVYSSLCMSGKQKNGIEILSKKKKVDIDPMQRNPAKLLLFQNLFRPAVATAHPYSDFCWLYDCFAHKEENNIHLIHLECIQRTVFHHSSGTSKNFVVNNS